MTAPLEASQLDGPVRVLAGPGAGKTHTLVSLYADLVEGGLAGRGQILVLTFSTSAAGEVARRLDERLLDSYDQAWISTFHSFCARLLRDHRPDPERLQLSGFQEWLAMRRVLDGLGPAQLGPFEPVRGNDTFAQDVLAFVALLKQNLVYPSAFLLLAEAAGGDRMRALAAVYAAYQARLEAAHLADFRDLVAGAIGLLGARPNLLKAYRDRFRYVLVDEFQDVDPAQFELLRLLAPPEMRPRLLVVGDPDQSIYGFRGTVPRLLSEEFPSTYGGRSQELELSRRCPAPVLEAAQRLLAASQPGLVQRTLRAENPGDASSLQVAREANGVDEAFYVAREIKRTIVEEGLAAGDFAILLRSSATLSAPFEEAIRALQLPYEVRGVGAMARNEVVRYLLAYLGALDRPDQPGALERVLSSSLSGVDQRTVGRIRRYAIEQGRDFDRVARSLMHRLAGIDQARHPLPWGGETEPDPEATLPDYAAFMAPSELDDLHAALTSFHRLRRRTGELPLPALAYAVLLETGVMARLLDLPVPLADREEALADLRATLGGFTELEAVWERLTGAPPRLDEVAQRLEALVARAVDDTRPAPPTRDAVQILTVHQSKGLEFEVVFLAGFAHGIFPLAARPHAVLDEEDQAWLERNLEGFRPSWPSDAEGHLAEEARLAYVGMTRARRRLYLTYADDYDRRAGPSPFLELAAPDTPVRSLSRAAGVLDPATLLSAGEAETLLALAQDGIGEAAQARLKSLGVDLEFVLDPGSGRPFEPYRSAPDGVEPGHYSATALNDYLKCPRLYWYNQHPGLVRTPRTVEMARGGFLHEVLEDFHNREPEWRELPGEAQREWLEAALTPHLSLYLDDVESVLERRAEEQEVRRILDNYIRFATSFQPILRRGTLATEKRFKLAVDGAEVRGKIDRINDTGDGTCEVVDYKTGRGHSVSRSYEAYFGPEMHDVQLALYYLACREGVDDDGVPLALRPRFLSLWYPKDWVYGTVRQVLFPIGGPALGVKDWNQRPLGDGDLDRSREVVARAIAGIRAGDFKPRPRDVVGTCLSYFGCPHAQICPFGGTPPE